MIDPSLYVPAVFPLINFVLIVGVTIAGMIFGSRKIDGKVELIIDRLQHSADHDDRAEARLERLVGAFEQVVSEARRTADACERSCEAVVESVKTSTASLDAANAMQSNAHRMANIVEQLARDFIAAAAAGAANLNNGGV